MDSMDRRGIIMPDESKSSVSKLLVVLVIIAILLSTVALIVALISLTQQRGGGTNVTVARQSKEEQLITDEERIWNIAIGHYTSSLVYIHGPSGQLKGFHVDMINAVCRLANKNCRLVYDISQRCWDSEKGQLPRGGVGLMSGWYDACAGWIKSHTRARTFEFSKSWTKPVNYYLIIKTGNPKGFDRNDVTNKTLGFVDGFINDEFCLARQTSIMGSTLSTSQITHYQLPDDLFQGILAGEVDAGLAVCHNLPDGLTCLDDVTIDCSMDRSGAGLMLRMDNELTYWWDPALERLMQTSEYRQICQDINDVHGHLPGRAPKDMCIGLQ
ncbi:L-arginine-binding protein-like [Amphiura filiformis]|uniref:L-arginine-binding protein-like n=1 Tax=Amphiura filiformis TaxID=82378 RepID=UPI003B20DEA7